MRYSVIRRQLNRVEPELGLAITGLDMDILWLQPLVAEKVEAAVFVWQCLLLQEAVNIVKETVSHRGQARLPSGWPVSSRIIAHVCATRSVISPVRGLVSRYTNSMK